MKRLLGNASLLVMSLIVTLGVAEVVLRQAISTPPKYEDVIRKLVDRPERLFAANTSVLYNIKGLYEGADTVQLKVSKNRYIEPEPKGSPKYRVLFLGGSTTEAIYVPQDERWVTLLNEPGYLGAYNAAQSGANTIDEYFTFQYLSAQGIKFDLVVLATGQNDLGWQQLFEKHRHRFVLEEYKKGLYDYYANEVDSKQRSFEPPHEQSAIRRVAAEAFNRGRQFLNLRSSATATPIVSPNNVTETYLTMRQAAISTFSNDKRPADLTLIDRYPNLKDLNEKYRANAVQNIGLLNQAVTDTGAKLLVITEATSWLAPTSSFYQDLRIPSGMSSFEDLHEYRLVLNTIFLDAAREAGALTYDLAADVNPYSNGPEGGRYMYDNMHYTPEGCRLVARFMRRVLHRVLEQGSLE
jgi:hypothetical protein